MKLNRSFSITFTLFFSTFLLQSCGGGGGSSEPAPTPSTPVAPVQSVLPSGLLFTNATQASGLEYWQNRSSLAFMEAAIPGGAAAGDYNNDGWIDLYVTRFDGTDILYQNNADGTFTDITSTTGIDHAFNSNGAAWGDIDNDDDLDLVITFYGENGASALLYINNSDGTFSKASVDRLANHEVRFAGSIGFGDYDRDGWLDIFIGDWNNGFSSASSVLLHNKGQAAPGFFEDATQTVGIDLNGLRVLTSSWADFNNDQWPDLALTSDFGDSKMFWNNGDGSFRDGTAQAQVGTDKNGMGSAIADMNNDGFLDWFITAIYHPDSLPEGNRLFINNGNEVFTDDTDTYGFRDGGWGWGTSFLDIDNNGQLELLMTAGVLLPEMWWQSFFGTIATDEEILDTRRDPIKLWFDTGSEYVDLAQELGLSSRDQGKSIVKFDYDNDGDLDIFVVNNSHPSVLYRNDSETDNDWIRINVKGIISNHDGIGARIQINYGNNKFQIGEVSASDNFQGQDEKTLHFGLAQDSVNGVITSIEVKWPSGHLQFLDNVAVNQTLLITEPSALPDADGDGITFVLDNCPDLSNPLQENNDGDLEGDFCDADDDNDGLSDIVETNTGVYISANSTGTDPFNADSDNDGLLDGFETNSGIFTSSTNTGSNPLSVDSDNDGLWDIDEVTLFNTDPSVDNSNLRFSTARLWNEDLMNAIRRDYPAPTVHSRNLFHVSAAMWDAWAVYDATADGFFVTEKQTAANIEDAREEAMSYAAFRILMHRFANSPGSTLALTSFERRMLILGYDANVTSALGSSPSAVGNRIAQTIINFGLSDGANEQGSYADNTGYAPVNERMIVRLPGAGTVNDKNRWQPLALDFIIAQNGLPLSENVQTFLGSHWGNVSPFALTRNNPQEIYDDPGLPPYLGGIAAEDLEFKQAVNRVIRFSSQVSPDDTIMVDISPSTFGNNSLGTNNGLGHTTNPETGQPYATNLVLRGDFQRILAEFWADGPDSETPPGHWNTLANYVTDEKMFEPKIIAGVGSAVSDLEWDVKLYFSLNGAVHDAAIAAWDAKRKYDYVRPITSIRYMGELGQSSNQADTNTYHVDGLLLEPGLVEVITSSSSGAGMRHESLQAFVGEIAILAWLGNPEDPETEYGGVGWIRAVNWVPYQRETFVTPPFAGYVSGHSSFSRASAEIMTAFTSDAFFPGGLGTFTAQQDEYLEFEIGPSAEVELQWATYFDAADQAGISRLSGGIHVDVDDLNGRIMGSKVGLDAWAKAQTYYDGSAH